MTKDLALQIIGASEDNLEEAFELHVFSIKQRLISVPFNSVLINARINEVKRAYAVECALSNSEEQSFDKSNITISTDLEFLAELERRISVVKGRIMSALSVKALLQDALNLIVLANEYEKIVCKAPFRETDKSDPKQIPDPHLLKKEMEELGIEDMSDEKLHTFAGHDFLIFSEKRRVAKYFK